MMFISPKPCYFCKFRCFKLKNFFLQRHWLCLENGNFSEDFLLSKLQTIIA